MPDAFDLRSSIYITVCFLRSLPCRLQVHHRIHRVLNQGQRFSMLRQSECKLPWSVPSSAACRTQWGPTRKAHPDSFRELAEPSVSLVCSNKLFLFESASYNWLLSLRHSQPPWVQLSLPPSPSLQTNGRCRMR